MQLTDVKTALGMDIQPKSILAFFNLRLAGIRNFMNVHLRGIKLFLSDGMRDLFNDFLVEELKIHDNLIKYGKIKGWILSPPAYGQHN